MGGCLRAEQEGTAEPEEAREAEPWDLSYLIGEEEAWEEQAMSKTLWYVSGVIFGYKPDYDVTIIETDGGGTLELPGYVGEPDVEIEIRVTVKEET